MGEKQSVSLKPKKEKRKTQKELMFFRKLIQQSFGFVKKDVLEFLLYLLYAIFL